MEIHEDKLEAVSESQCSMLSDMGDLQERGALHQVPTPTSAPGFSSTEGGDPVGAQQTPYSPNCLVTSKVLRVYLGKENVSV